MRHFTATPAEFKGNHNPGSYKNSDCDFNLDFSQAVYNCPRPPQQPVLGILAWSFASSLMRNIRQLSAGQLFVCSEIGALHRHRNTRVGANGPWREKPS